MVLTSQYNKSQATGEWVHIETEEFIFYDGTSTEPMPRQTVDENFLRKSSQITGLTLSSLAISIALGSAVWVCANRKTQVVKASQPEFLYLLCFGATLLATSLIFISFDERDGFTESQLSSMCQSFVWLSFLGYLIMYCALFCSLWRLSMLLQMRRRAVQIHQVTWPFSVIIASSVLVLIVWHSIDPLVWDRVVVSTIPLETYGGCRSLKYSSLPFVISLGCLVGIVVAMTAVVAWKLRNADSSLAASRFIFYGICSHVQIFAIAIPTFLIVADVSKDASYIIITTVGFIISVSLVVLVIWPRIYTQIRDKYFGGPPSESFRRVSVIKRSVHVSGLPGSGPSTPAFRQDSPSSLHGLGATNGEPAVSRESGDSPVDTQEKGSGTEDFDDLELSSSSFN